MVVTFGVSLPLALAAALGPRVLLRNNYLANASGGAAQTPVTVSGLVIGGWALAGTLRGIEAFLRAFGALVTGSELQTIDHDGKKSTIRVELEEVLGPSSSDHNPQETCAQMLLKVFCASCDCFRRRAPVAHRSVGWGPSPCDTGGPDAPVAIEKLPPCVDVLLPGTCFGQVRVNFVCFPNRFLVVTN